MLKLDCYVDETGQDTRGSLFVVGVVVPLIEREDCRSVLRGLEEESKRGPRKWAKSTHAQRESWLQLVAERNEFRLFFAHFGSTLHYLRETIRTTADAISIVAPAPPAPPFKVNVFVDGLPKRDYQGMGAALRRRLIPVRKVRGLNDESDEMIRLADSVAGFARDQMEGADYANGFYQRMVGRGLLTKLVVMTNSP